MRASGINRTATSAGVRTAEFRAQPQRNRYAHGLVVKPKPASSDRQRQKPVATMCRACCQETCTLERWGSSLLYCGWIGQKAWSVPWRLLWRRLSWGGAYKATHRHLKDSTNSSVNGWRPSRISSCSRHYYYYFTYDFLPCIAARVLIRISRRWESVGHWARSSTKCSW